MAGMSRVAFRLARLGAAVALWGLFGAAACLAAEGDKPRQVTPRITAGRQGRLLNLSCELVGADSRQFVNANQANPPTFTVYKGKRKVGSGTFAYG